MQINYSMPPEPRQHAVLKRIYPWDEYDITLVMQWLFTQAQKTGFLGTFEDFKERYGAYIEASDPQDINDLINNYTGTYRVKPLIGIEQILKTKNKILNQNIIIEPIPEDLICQHQTYGGKYSVTPSPLIRQKLYTANKLLTDNIIVEKIPYKEVPNEAGGTTVIIGVID